MLEDNNITETEKTEAEQLGISESTEAGKYRRWMLTIPASSISEELLIEKLSKYRGFAGQLEEGKKKNEKGQGYLHFQVYVEHKDTIRFETLKNLFPKAHLSIARENAETCVAYVTKEDTRVTEPFWGGSIDFEQYQGKRNDLETMRQRLIDGDRIEDLIFKDPRALRNAVALQHFQLVVDEKNIPKRREVKAHYLHGVTGTGKSRMIWERFDYDLRKLHAISEYKHGAWDTYSAHEVVLLDEFRGQWNISFMLRLLDRYPLLLPARYRDRVAGFEEVWILSNKPLSSLYEREDERSRSALRRRFDSIGELMHDGTIKYERINGEEVENAEASK